MSVVANPVQTIPVEAVVFRKDLYPRFTPDAATIQRYQESLDHLPPIEVNQRMELIDGYHRWNAHKEAGAAEVPAMVTPTESDDHLLELAIDRNAKHGMQLSQDDKRKMAVRLFTSRQRSEEELAKLLSVSNKSIQRWLSDIKKAQREEQKATVADMWMACYSQPEIAEATEVPQQTISGWMEDLPKLDTCPNPVKVAAQYQEAEWKTPLYNVWTWSKDDDTAVDHFGNSHVGIVDRLLYLFTEPFDVVVDPFAGAGSTVDICRKRARRYWCADRKVKSGLAEQKHIRTRDIAEGPPNYLPWSDVKLLYLDPPYWKQAEGQYSDDPSDLANMDLEIFYDVLTSYVKAAAKKMPSGSHVAILIQPTQWKSGPTREVVDHVFDICKRLDNGTIRLIQRISCPYSSQQMNPQMVEWAKANKRLLVLTRELMVFEVA